VVLVELQAVGQVVAQVLLQAALLVLALVRVPALVRVRQVLAEPLDCPVRAKLRLVSVRASVLDNGAAVSVTRRPKKAR
jgi:hypothetical protein